MKLNKWIRTILIGGSILALTACSSAHKSHDESAVNDANSAYNNGAQSSGLGEESGFGDQASGSQQGISKRTYYFDFDSNVVHDEDKPAIDANADYLLSHRNAKVMLEGHTDPRGSREYNVALGERRANAVAEFMKAKGVNPEQIRVVSYGAQRLAAPGRTEHDYQLDRRVVLVYVR